MTTRFRATIAGLTLALSAASGSAIAQCNATGYKVSEQLLLAPSSTRVMTNKVSCWGDYAVGSWKGPTEADSEYSNEMHFPFRFGIGGERFCEITKTGNMEFTMNFGGAARSAANPWTATTARGIAPSARQDYVYYISACRAYCLDAPN